MDVFLANQRPFYFLQLRPRPGPYRSCQFSDKNDSFCFSFLTCHLTQSTLGLSLDTRCQSKSVKIIRSYGGYITVSNCIYLCCVCEMGEVVISLIHPIKCDGQVFAWLSFCLRPVLIILCSFGSVDKYLTRLNEGSVYISGARRRRPPAENHC